MVLAEQTIPESRPLSLQVVEIRFLEDDVTMDNVCLYPQGSDLVYRIKLSLYVEVNSSVFIASSYNCNLTGLHTKSFYHTCSTCILYRVKINLTRRHHMHSVDTLSLNHLTLVHDADLINYPH